VLVDSGDWRVFTGNEMGCLLIWWMIHVYKSKGVGPGKMCSGSDAGRCIVCTSSKFGSVCF